MNERDLVYARVLDRNLSFSLHGLRHRLPEDERDYWSKYIGKEIHIDDENKRGLLQINPRGAYAPNFYVVAAVRNGYAWLRDESDRVDQAEKDFIESYCAHKHWNPKAATMEQMMEIVDQPGFRHAGEIKKPRKR